MTAPESISLLGCRLDIVTWRELGSMCRSFLEGSSAKHIVTLNGEIALNASRDPNLLKAINSADLVVADSTNIVSASFLKLRKRLVRTPGVDIVNLLANLASERGKRIFLLGGRHTVGERAAARLKERYSDLQIAGVSAANPDDKEVIADIRDSGADIVFVAYGSPKQELWISRHKNLTKAKILIGVGGALDMIAGVLPRAPLFFRRLGLEWLWRLILQPTRFKRILRAVILFPVAVLLSDNQSDNDQSVSRFV